MTDKIKLNFMTNSKIKIISWNILHIIHEYNYVGEESLVISEFPDEQVRIEKIMEKIQKEFESEEQIIINLQEVPGDYLDKLKEKFSDNIYFYSYSRLATLKKNMKCPYNNMTESLVSIVKINDKMKEQSFYDFDRGKSALILRFENFTLYNIHLPFQYNKNMETDESSIIVGDFNCSGEEAVKIFVSTTKCENNKETFITRREGIVKTDTLDHILTKNLNVSNPLSVEETKLSDHYVVYAYLYL
jgi:hypothetical protein